MLKKAGDSGSFGIVDGASKVYHNLIPCKISRNCSSVG